MMRQHWFGSVSFFVLAVSGTAIAQPSPRPLTLGQAVQSSMGPEDPILEGDDSSYEMFQVQAPKGQMVTITMTSKTFEPVVVIGAEIVEECQGCATGIGEKDRPAIVRKLVPDSGVLQVRANTMNKGDRGAYTIVATSSVPPRLAARPLPFGQSVSESLGANDPVTDEGTLVDAYAVRLAANQEIQLDLSSDDFDPKLELLTPAGAKVAEDDDGGPGTNARIRFVVPRAGLYQVRTTSVGSMQMGRYTLSTGLRQRLAPLPAPTPIVLGRSVSGVIDASTPRYEADGEEISAKRYVVTMNQGQVYRVTLNATENSNLDPKLAIGVVASDGAFDPTEREEEGGGGKNAGLRFRPSETRPYVIEAQQIGKSGGGYELTVEEAITERGPEPPQTLLFGGVVSGELREGGARLLSSDALFKTYLVALRAGQKIVLSMEKAEEANLDPKVEIGLLGASAFEVMAEDDDGGEGLNAKLKFVAPTTGTYMIRATASEPVNTGSFSIGVREVPPSGTPPFPMRAKFGETIKGSLGSNDPMRNDSQYYDRYIFNAQVGETFEISANAEDFDILVGARPIDRVDDDYSSDDDSGGGTNAKLVYTVTNPGQQIIRITTVEETAGGDYTLLIVKK
ncbi:MAG: hypothetical protein CFE32_06005 [Alphaproteobacteria bacterium PA3]|nr:MAG: hypothetical protein CFE32_06005 [Alphaproteobacteria bacterium PA3]